MQTGSSSRVAGAPTSSNAQRVGSAAASNKLPQKKLTISLKKGPSDVVSIWLL
jgi:hypothetical protein